MTKRYKPLTVDQVQRGVIFSSQLMPGAKIHEVKEDDEDKEAIIKRLMNDSFFNNSPYKYNEIRK